jgi:hypothetical protein
MTLNVFASALPAGTPFLANIKIHAIKSNQIKSRRAADPLSSNLVAQYSDTDIIALRPTQ